MDTLLHKTDHFTNPCPFTDFFDLEEIEILTEVFKVLTCHKGQTISLSADSPVLVVQSPPNCQPVKETIRLEQSFSKENITFTPLADGVYCIVEKHIMQDLLKKHPFLALKLNQMTDTRLTFLLGKN